MKITNEMVEAAKMHIFHYGACAERRCQPTATCECAIEARNALTAALATQPDRYAQGFERAREMALDHIQKSDPTTYQAMRAIQSMEMPDE